MFVSIASISLANMPSNGSLHVGNRFGTRRATRKEHLVHIRRTETSSPADYDITILFVPFNN
jgi:hypothetical protein